MRRVFRVSAWTAGVILALLVLVTIVASIGSRTDRLRALVISTLAERLDSEVELGSFSVDTFPTVLVTGSGLVVRHKGRRDVPPLVTIESFQIRGTVLGMLGRPRRFQSVALTGLQVSIPPGGLRGAAAGVSTSTPASVAQAAIVIDRLVSDDALLVLVPRVEGKSPRQFAVHDLTMEGIGRGEPMPFEATVTNPVPSGLVRTKGTFGPWQKEEPGQTPISGEYVFSDADLSTIKGIGGTLTSEGVLRGMLARIEVDGRTSTPDFRVNVSGNPVALETTFKAVVDGTDGDTYLNSVSAKLLETSLSASGAVIGQKGIKGRTVNLRVNIDDGRIEDVLRLAVKSEAPVMTGRLALEADLHLPPGSEDVMDRLQLSGEFAIAQAQFASSEVRSRLAEMSARARGARQDGRHASVMSNMRGRFRMNRSMLSLPVVHFTIPGARVQVAGRYGLRDESLEFDGAVRMDATVSEAAGGGVKSLLLKAVDPLFRRDGAGAVIPIRVRGSRDAPKFSVDVGRVLRR